VPEEARISRRGPAPRATRDEVLAAAVARYLASERIDVLALSAELGVSRASVYRWFGSREGLIGEVLIATAEQLVAQARRDARGSGAARLLDAFDRINRGLASSDALRHFLGDERIGALRMLASGAGPVQPTMVRLIREIIDEEAQAGHYEPPTDAETLAYAIVRLAESFLFNDAVADLKGDVDRLRAGRSAVTSSAKPMPQVSRLGHVDTYVSAVGSPGESA
jgi:AcrR family transcriptional regulator